MGLDGHGDLAAAEIGFYGVALVIGVGICFKQGSFKRNAGWFYLVLLSVLRLIGSACILYMETQHDTSSALQETATITSAIGTAPLLLTLMGLLQRVHNQMTTRSLSPNLFRPIHIVAIVALVLAIIGGVFESKSNPNDVRRGQDLTEAASILFLLVYIALAFIAFLTSTRLTFVPSTETKLAIASLCVLPFLLVRVIYTIAVAFAKPGSDFYFRDVNVWVQAFMQFMMEAMAVVVYIWAGLFTPKQEPNLGPPVDYKPTEQNVRMTSDEEAGLAPTPQPRRQRPQRSIGDYRPSRLIMNAIRDRD